MMSNRQEVKNGRVLWNIFIFILGLTLIWLIATHSLTAGLSKSNPQISKSLNADYPTTSIAEAEQELGKLMTRRREAKAAEGSQAEQPNQKTTETLRQESGILTTLSENLKRVIAGDPLNAGAFRTLGQISSLQGNSALTRRMMSEATKLSLHEAIALDYMLRESFAAKNYKASLFYADALLSSYPQFLTYELPLLSAMTEMDASRKDLVNKLAEQPRWRASFFDLVAQSTINDPYAPLNVLLALKETSSAPQLSEINGYLGYLFKQKKFDLAYSTWLQFLPEDQLDQTGLLFNRSFELPLSGNIFDWTIGSGVEVDVAITARPDDDAQKSLFVSFGQGRVTFPTVQEVILLTPGDYHFSGVFKGEVKARRGLKWTIICPNGASAGEDDMILGRAPNWRKFEFDFTIPKDGCAYQYVRLIHDARSPSEQLASGTIWFDDLIITRQENQK